MIDATIVADSINPDADRITTFLLTYPRFIHSELMTHRAFSRNSASSRAIPLQTMLDAVKRNPATPVFWAKNQKGMQATEEVDSANKAEYVWGLCAVQAILGAETLSTLGLHKAICNRVVEPFTHMTTLVTATEYHNFFALRAHPDAQQEFQLLAHKMLKLYLSHRPAEIGWDDWHLPYHNPSDLEGLSLNQKIQICVARACRTSYTRFAGTFASDEDIALYDRALASGHMSVFEHPAKASPGWHANFCGWIPYRTMIAGENKSDADLQEIYKNRPDWVANLL